MAEEKDGPKLGKRAAARAETMRRITEIGREQLDAEGVAGLSLREVARELGMVSSAVYRYVGSRDELLTLLLVDSFTDLAGAAYGADYGAAGMPARRRYIEVAGRVRAWAVAHPERWTLLYGSPVRGYSAPGDETTGPGTRVMALFVDIAAGADLGAAPGTDPGAAASESWPADGLELDAAARDMLGRAARELAEAREGAGVDHSAAGAEGGTDTDSAREPASPEVLAVMASLWVGTVGAVTAEIFGQWGPLPPVDAEAIFGAQIEVLSRLLGHGDAVD